MHLGTTQISQITKLKKAKQDTGDLVPRMKELRAGIPALEAKKTELDAQRQVALRAIGNMVHESVPVSNNEDNNAVVSTWGGSPTPKGLAAGSEVLHHHELLAMLGGYEPERGAAVAGHRGYFLRGPGLALNMALQAYGAAFLRARGYDVVQPPYFMNKDVMAGVAQLDDFDDQLYKVVAESEDPKKPADEKYLIATSEQPICAFHKGENLLPTALPLKYGGLSTCFRKEAGKHGKDVWGIFRVHQFEKVEQFVICEPGKSWEEHENMREVAEEFYKSLGIPYNVVNIVSGELNSAAAKKYDLEGWFPGYGEYKELVSASNCTDYQSRAMEIRLGHGKTAEGNKEYVHMLNATLCATTRTICAILENHQTAEGVTVPEALVPFTGGVTFFPFTQPRPKSKDTAKGGKKGGAAAGGAAKKTAAPKQAGGAAAAGAPPTAKAAPAPVAPKESTHPAAGSGLQPSARPSLATKDGQAALNGLLATLSFVDGFKPTAEDDAVASLVAKHTAGGAVDATLYPNTARWFNTVTAHSAAERAAWPVTGAQVGAGGARASTLFCE